MSPLSARQHDPFANPAKMAHHARNRRVLREAVPVGLPGGAMSLTDLPRPVTLASTRSAGGRHGEATSAKQATRSRGAAARSLATPAALLDDVRSLIRQAREATAQAVNSALVLLYWQIGQRIRTEVLNSRRLPTVRRFVRHCRTNCPPSSEAASPGPTSPGCSASPRSSRTPGLSRRCRDNWAGATSSRSSPSRTPSSATSTPKIRWHPDGMVHGVSEGLVAPCAASPGALLMLSPGRREASNHEYVCERDVILCERSYFLSPSK